ncbi:MAG: hypothetical protein NVSMB20_03200 [Bradyrhizobium sp.]
MAFVAETTAALASKLKAALPARWFPDTTPVLDAPISGFAAAWAALSDQLAYTSTQSRLTTVSDAWLDIAAADFKPKAFGRKPGESDAVFRARLVPILRDKVTRAALIGRLKDLTGNTATVFEPSLPADANGGYGTSMGYGVAGHFYGSIVNPFQVFITLQRPLGQGVAVAAGYGQASGGYRTGYSEYASLDLAAPHVTDQDIYNAVVETLPVGTIGWVKLSGATASAGTAPLGSFYLGVNTLAP